MTNTEYEKLSTTAANPEAALARADDVIASIEAALAVAQEARREIINRYGLNKPCAHELSKAGAWCEHCGRLWNLLCK